MSAAPATAEGASSQAGVSQGRSLEPAHRSALDASLLYWSVIDVPTGSRIRSGELPAGLIPHLQDDLPVAVEEVHAVCAPIGPDRIVACAAPKQLLATVDPSLIELRPAGIPKLLGIGTALDAGALNLLVGEFEPAPLKRARSRRHVLAAATILLCTVIIAVGLARRSAQWTGDAARFNQQAQQLLAERTFDRSEKSLMQNRDAARQVQMLTSSAKLPADATEHLQALLRDWPTSVPSKPQTLTVTSEGISIAITIDGDPAPFLAAFKAPAGFTLDEPKLNTSSSVTRVSLFLRPNKGGSR